MTVMIRRIVRKVYWLVTSSLRQELEVRLLHGRFSQNEDVFVSSSEGCSEGKHRHTFVAVAAAESILSRLKPLRVVDVEGVGVVVG